MDIIIKTTPLNDYRIEILTKNGISGIFDVKPYLHGSAFNVGDPSVQGHG